MPWSDVLVMMTSCRTKPGLTTTFQIRRAAGGAVASFRLLRHNWPRPRSETSPEPLPFHLDPTQHGRRGFCRIGMSCAIRRSPRGSIQRPKRGKKLKMPPRINIPATMTRIQNLDGSRSQRMKVPTFVGTRRSINAKYLFSPNMTEAMPIPIRASVKAPHHNNAAWGAKPTGGGVFLRPGCAQRKSAARSLGHAEPSEVLSTRCPCLRRGTTRHRHREMPIKQKPPGVTPNGFSSRLPVSWFCRQIQTAFSPFVPFESPAVSRSADSACA
ncbi:hypothetical protein ABIF44_003161 [Bradyrhizobium japonicum]|nr:hypothetical protein [Bradyrhizobium japonicum]MCS3990535.1 hypothetical protein [Bradyrhizobium japonicum]MCS4014651.1 hypothetical protein [Bradyrhizobium japonicum]MCS4210659.1 hypothetical protein [Bradyrhizobium japonicum]MDH6178467.1 hypothetical protein [Bradyrhizobium japonicum]